jgi:hypothetical protein
MTPEERRKRRRRGCLDAEAMVSKKVANDKDRDDATWVSQHVFRRQRTTQESVSNLIRGNRVATVDLIEVSQQIIERRYDQSVGRRQRGTYWPEPCEKVVEVSH